MGFTLNQLEQERQIRKLQKKEDKDTKDYEQLSNLPKINNVELKGDKTTSDLGINATNVIMSDGVTSVEDALDANTLGTGVSLTYDTVFTAPSDGYVNAIVTNGANQYVTIYLIRANNAEILMTRGFASTDNGGITALYVKKGMKVKFIGTSSSVATAAFYPLQ